MCQKRLCHHLLFQLFSEEDGGEERATVGEKEGGKEHGSLAQKWHPTSARNKNDNFFHSPWQLQMSLLDCLLPFSLRVCVSVCRSAKTHKSLQENSPFLSHIMRLNNICER